MLINVCCKISGDCSRMDKAVHMLMSIKLVKAVCSADTTARHYLTKECLMYCRGGLIKWADLLGAKVVADKLNGWAKQFEPAGLAGFFKPCKYLQDAADNKTSLEAGRKSSSKM